MDTFIDKIAQKRNAQEMIRANMTAEAVKMEQMENQMKAYDELMQEIRQVNLKTAQNVTELQDVLKDCVSRLEAMQEQDAGEGALTGQELAQIREIQAVGRFSAQGERQGVPQCAGGRGGGTGQADGGTEEEPD